MGSSVLLVDCSAQVRFVFPRKLHNIHVYVTRMKYLVPSLKVVYDDHMKGKNHAAKVNKLTLIFDNFPKLSNA